MEQNRPDENARHEERPDPSPSRERSASDRVELPFRRLGEFELLEPLGEGGMGRVYLARQQSLDRQVALKIVQPDLQSSPQTLERFRREAQALARLDHRHILHVHAFGEDEGVSYLVTERVPGRSLAEVLAQWREESRGPSILDVVRWTAQIARALAHAHEHGLVHRDVKPSNVHIRPDGDALLMDFGLVRIVGGTDSTLTEEFLGSPMYASPEQIEAVRGGVDHRSDVYSLGATLYEALTLRPPVLGSTLRELMHGALHLDPVPPRQLQPQVPRDLQTVVQKAMQKDAAHRYASASALAADLDAVLEFRPISARPPSLRSRLRQLARRRPAVATVVATVLVTLAGFGGWRLWELHRQGLAEQEQLRLHLAEAQRLGAAVKRSCRELLDLELEAARLEERAGGPFPRDRDVALLDQVERRLHEERRTSWSLEARLVHEIQAAQRLRAEHEDLLRIQADLYAGRWRLAAGLRRFEEAAELARLIELYDEEERYTESTIRRGAVTVLSDPAAAAIHLFRYRPQTEVVSGGEFRLVPCPVSPEDPEHDASSAVPPGSVVLRVVRAAGDLRVNDLIVSVEGRPIEGTLWVVEGNAEVLALDRLVSIDGVPVSSLTEVHYTNDRFNWGRRDDPHCFEFESEDGESIEVWSTVRSRTEYEILVQFARETQIVVGEAEDLVRQGGVWCQVFRDGRLEEMSVPEGVQARRTATPLVLSESTVAGSTPLRAHSLPFGDYVGLARLAGHEDVRFTIQLGVEEPEQTVSLQMWPEGTTPLGMVYVADAPPGPFWISDHELTAAEYLEFLRDREQREGRMSETDELLPTWIIDGEPMFRRGPDGRLEHSLRTAPRTAMSDLPRQAVHEYLDWHNRRERARGGTLRVSLPTRAEWQYAARGNTSRRFVYGDRARPSWNNTMYHLTTFGGAIPVRSICRDESPYGVYDLSGGLSEWVLVPSRAGNEGHEQAAIGGSHVYPVVAGSPLGNPVRPAEGQWEESTVGIRLVAHPAMSHAR